MPPNKSICLTGRKIRGKNGGNRTFFGGNCTFLGFSGIFLSRQVPSQGFLCKIGLALTYISFPKPYRVAINPYFFAV